MLYSELTAGPFRRKAAACILSLNCYLTERLFFGVSAIFDTQTLHGHERKEFKRNRSRSRSRVSPVGSSFERANLRISIRVRDFLQKNKNNHCLVEKWSRWAWTKNGSAKCCQVAECQLDNLVESDFKKMLKNAYVFGILYL